MRQLHSIPRLVVCLLAGAVALPAGRALAQSENVRIPIDMDLQIPCANGGAGENVALTGNLHVRLDYTVSGNKAQGRFHYQPQGITGYGDVSGDEYHATGVTQGLFRTSLRDGTITVSMINNFRIIGQGPGNNFLVHENTHLTLSREGDVVAFVDNFRTDCK